MPPLCIRTIGAAHAIDRLAGDDKNRFVPIAAGEIAEDTNLHVNNLANRCMHPRTLAYLVDPTVTTCRARNDRSAHTIDRISVDDTNRFGLKLVGRVAKDATPRFVNLVNRFSHPRDIV